MSFCPLEPGTPGYGVSVPLRPMLAKAGSPLWGLAGCGRCLRQRGCECRCAGQSVCCGGGEHCFGNKVCPQPQVEPGMALRKEALTPTHASQVAHYPRAPAHSVMFSCGSDVVASGKPTAGCSGWPHCLGWLQVLPPHCMLDHYKGFALSHLSLLPASGEGGSTLQQLSMQAQESKCLGCASVSSFARDR